MAPDLKVVQLHETVLTDVPGNLRKLADAIEAGEYGGIGTCAVVLMGDTLEVFGFGSDSAGPSSALVLQAGALRFARTLEEHGRE